MGILKDHFKFQSDQNNSSFYVRCDLYAQNIHVIRFGSGSDQMDINAGSVIGFRNKMNVVPKILD